MVKNLAQALPDAPSIASALLVLIWTCLCFFSILSQHKRKTLRLLIRGFIGSTALLVLSGYILAHRFPNSHPLPYPLESPILAASTGLLISGGVMKCCGSRKWLPLVVGILAAIVSLGIRKFAIARGAISPAWEQSALAWHYLATYLSVVTIPRCGPTAHR